MKYFEKFDSLTKFRQAIDSRPINPIFQNRTLASVSGSRYFTGTESYDEASALMANGDNTNLDKINSVHIDGTIKDSRKFLSKIEKSICGCMPNVPAYINGVPQNMFNFRRVQRSTKIVNVVINGTVSADVATSDIVKVAARIASVISSVEKRGLRANLYVTFASKRDNDNVGVLICLKKSSAPLNLLNIAYPLINPSMLRRHFFKFLETCPVRIAKGYADGYGRPSECNDEVRKIVPDAHIMSFAELLNADTQVICDKLTK